MENVNHIVAETRGHNSYALYMNSSYIVGDLTLLEVIANGTNGVALYMVNSDLDTLEGALIMIRMKENAQNQVISGQNSRISGITLMPDSLSIPETDGITLTLGDI